MLKTFTATRYITPLREGGSLPAIVEVDDGSLYVMKFVGAGQGAKALIAELISGEVARLLGLPVPEIAFINLDPMIGRSEPDPEIQDLLQNSAGLNLGLKYLPNATAFNILLAPPPDATLASKIVWFDAFVTNVDRTARNVNMIIWQNKLWLIDHGASLYFHHSWDDYLERSKSKFPMIKDHNLLSLASELREVDPDCRAALTSELLTPIIDSIPEHWLGGEDQFTTVADHRAGYLAYLMHRLEHADNFVEEAIRARS